MVGEFKEKVLVGDDVVGDVGDSDLSACSVVFLFMALRLCTLITCTWPSSVVPAIKLPLGLIFRPVADVRRVTVWLSGVTACTSPELVSKIKMRSSCKATCVVVSIPSTSGAHVNVMGRSLRTSPLPAFHRRHNGKPLATPISAVPSDENSTSDASPDGHQERGVDRGTLNLLSLLRRSSVVRCVDWRILSAMRSDDGDTLA